MNVTVCDYCHEKIFPCQQYTAYSAASEDHTGHQFIIDTMHLHKACIERMRAGKE